MKITGYYIIGCICTIVFLAWLLLVSCASAPTIISQTAGLAWEGDLNPTEFGKWKVVNTRPNRIYVWITAKNPDEQSNILFVSLVYDREDTLVGYSYWKNGEPYIFLYKPQLNKYMALEMSERERAQCFECHKDKVKTTVERS